MVRLARLADNVYVTKVGRLCIVALDSREYLGSATTLRPSNLSISRRESFWISVAKTFSAPHPDRCIPLERGGRSHGILRQARPSCCVLLASPTSLIIPGGVQRNCTINLNFCSHHRDDTCCILCFTGRQPPTSDRSAFMACAMLHQVPDETTEKFFPRTPH